MSLLTRFGALGALSVLAACGTSATVLDAGGNPVDVSEVFAAAATFTPTEDDGGSSVRDAAETDGGWQGMIGLEDGSLVPLKINIDDDANTLTVTLGDGTPIVFENTDPEGGNTSWYNEVEEQYVYFRSYGSGGGRFSGDEYNWMSLYLATAADDLPESGEVGYSGYFDMMAGEDSGAYGNLALAIDFGTGAVTGGLVGGTYSYDDFECCFREIVEIEDGPIYDEPSGDSFFGTIEGSVEGNLLAATSEFSGGTVDGSVSMLGVFTEGGSGVEGGIAGTIDGTTMGGTFEAYAGEGGGPP